MASEPQLWIVSRGLRLQGAGDSTAAEHPVPRGCTSPQLALPPGPTAAPGSGFLTETRTFLSHLLCHSWEHGDRAARTSSVGALA